MFVVRFVLYTSNKTNGLILINSLSSSSIYCLNPGYYYIGCKGAGIINIRYLDVTPDNEYNVNHDLTEYPHWKVLRLEQTEVTYTTVPQSHKKPDFDKSKPLTGKPAYPSNPTYEHSDFTCDQNGYLSYLSKWSTTMKCTSRDVMTEEFKTRLEYFIDSCEKIHDWNMKDKYWMEFTFYADWHPDEFEEITTTKQRYSEIITPIPSTVPVYNNSNLRYLMPSMDPCDDVFGSRRLEENTLREYICKPQNCSVTWAFATTMSIEYAIKKLYFEEYDQIVEVALSAQELIDCVGKEHGVTGKVCDGLPLAWAFDYIFENGIAYREFYHHTNKEEECKMIPDEQKYHIAGYEKPNVYNKLGLFDLVMKGPTAVTLGLDPEYFQYYRNDREEGPYFDTAFWRPSVYGVVVEYLQYAVEGQPEFAEWPFFAIEARLRACDSFVFRLPIRETEADANIAGIAGFAIRPIVSVLLPTPEPPVIPPTPTPSEFIASSDWDSIPLNVQSLIFDSNSFPDMIDVDLSNFTSLQSLQFREGSFASASSLTIIGYHIFLYSFIGLTQLNTILFHNHSFPITHSIILQDLSVHSIQVGEDCFNGIGSFEGRRLDSTSIAKLTLKNNGMLQEMKIPAGSFTQIKNIEMSNLQNLKMIEIEGEKGEKGAPFQSTSSFVTNGTPNLEVMKLGNKVCQSGSVFSIDSKMIKEVEIGKKCFQGTDKESQYGAKAQQFVMIDQPKLISTKIDKSSFVYFDTYNLMNNPKQMIANVAYSKSGNSSVSVDDLPSFSGVKEIVMKNLTSLEETVFGKGSFPNVTVINLSELPVVKNITLEEGSFGKTEELILVSE